MEAGDGSGGCQPPCGPHLKPLRRVRLRRQLGPLQEQLHFLLYSYIQSKKVDGCFMTSLVDIFSAVKNKAQTRVGRQSLGKTN